MNIDFRYLPGAVPMEDTLPIKHDGIRLRVDFPRGSVPAGIRRSLSLHARDSRLKR
jgi:hypothetical protein